MLGEWALSMVGVEEGREFRFRRDLYSQESTFPLVLNSVITEYFKKDSMLCLPVKFFFKSANIWQRYKQEGGRLAHVVRLATTLLKVEENAQHNPPFLPVTMPDIYDLKKLSLEDSAINLS